MGFLDDKENKERQNVNENKAMTKVVNAKTTFSTPVWSAIYFRCHSVNLPALGVSTRPITTLVKLLNCVKSMRPVWPVVPLVGLLKKRCDVQQPILYISYEYMFCIWQLIFIFKLSPSLYLSICCLYIYIYIYISSVFAKSLGWDFVGAV